MSFAFEQKPVPERGAIPQWAAFNFSQVDASGVELLQKISQYTGRLRVGQTSNQRRFIMATG